MNRERPLEGSAPSEPPGIAVDRIYRMNRIPSASSLRGRARRSRPRSSVEIMSIPRPWILVIGLLFEVMTASAAIIGDLGRQLSEPELVEIARLGSTNAIKPWLFVVQRGHFRGEFVYVYSAPTIDTPEIRRGTRALLSRRISDLKGAWEGWILNGRGWYAQVAIPGRDFARIEGEQDISQPFGVGSPLSNDDLVSLARLVRSSPSWMGPSGKGERVEGNWPIDSIERDRKGLVVIKTRKNNSSGQVVKLTMVRKEWQIRSIGFWRQ